MSYPAPPPASQPPASSSASQPPASGFFNDLFDIRFTRFVSLRLISVVYVLILAAVSLGALFVVFAGFTQGAGPGLFFLILAALGWIIYIVLARVSLEAFAVLFRIHDDTSRMVDALAGGRGPAPGGYTPPPSPGYGTTQPYAQPGYGQPPQGPPPAEPDGPNPPPWTS